MVVLKDDLLRLLLGRSVVGRLVKRVLCVLLNEGDEALKGTVAVVVDEVTRAGALELERGEARDAEGDAGREIVLGGLHLRNRDAVLEVSEVLAKLVPSGLETLAVTAPSRRAKSATRIHAEEMTQTYQLA